MSLTWQHHHLGPLQLSTGDFLCDFLKSAMEAYEAQRWRKIGKHGKDDDSEEEGKDDDSEDDDFEDDDSEEEPW